jgi:hypothetical protein
MQISTVLFFFLLQTPAQTTPAPVPATSKVLVGLTNGEQLLVEDPEFSGFIQGRNGEAMLLYRRAKFHGEMPANVISRIDFVKYRPGKPFVLIVSLKNGQRIEVESEYRSYVTLSGKTDAGTVLIKHPDPISGPLKLSTHPQNRNDDLTIQYLEFPAS